MSEENCRGLGLEHRWAKSEFSDREYCHKCGEARYPNTGWFLDLPGGTVTAEPGDEPEEDEYDSPNGSKWIVSIDMQGFVSILDKPNIHHSFFDCGEGAEEIGLPFEVCDSEPGVYEWTCNLRQTFCPETNCADGAEFDVIEEKRLWSVPNE